MNYSEEEIELAFGFFVSEAQRIVTEYMDNNFPTLPKQTIEVSAGRIYWKLTSVSEGPPSRTCGGIRSVHAFVRKHDGAVFRPAGPKAPYTLGKSAIRAYVTDDWASSVLTPHGVAYSR